MADLKDSEALDTTLSDGAFLFGVDSAADSRPKRYPVETVAGYFSSKAGADSAAASAAAAALNATSAEDWAHKTDGQVEAADYSSKAWAVGGTGVSATASRGAAKEWATKTPGSTVDGTEYSAKHYANASAASAASSAASAASAVAVSGALPRVDRTSLKALSTGSITTAWLTEAGREGMFQWRSGDYSTQVAADTYEGLYIKANAIASSSGAWVRVYTGPACVDWFGPAGDGTTNDTDRVRSALYVIGVNGTALFAPGKTYLIDGSVVVPVGQTVIGYGATIKKAAQVQTTTTQSVTSGVTTSFTVASTAGLRVGMDLVLADSGTSRVNLDANTTLSTAPQRITAIVGSTVTTNLAPNASLSSGAIVVNSYISFQCNSRVRIFGLTFDGNRSNRSWTRWQVEQAVNCVASTVDCIIYGVTVTSEPGEGIYLQGDYHRVMHCKVDTLGGNAIHMSGAIHPLVADNRLTNGNLDMANGHADGAVCWSNGITDATISNNFMSGCVSGIGSFDDTNTDATITGNTIRDCYCWGIYCAAGAARGVINDNRIYNCATDTSKVPGKPAYGGIYFNVTGADFAVCGNYVSGPINLLGNTGATRYVVKGNIATEACTFAGVKSSVISGNVFAARVSLGWATYNAMQDVLFDGNTIDITGNTTDPALKFVTGSCYSVRVTGNNIRGGSINVLVAGSVSALAGSMIAENTLVGAYSVGVECDTTADGLSVNRNQIVANSASQTSWIGVKNSGTKARINANEIVNIKGSNVNIGVYVDASSGVIVKDNVITGPLSSASVRLTTSGHFVLNNAVITSVVDDTSGSTVSGNQAI